MNEDLIGLVLAGGRSTRMGQDKSSLQYFSNQTQRERMSCLLNKYCEEVHISCTIDQKKVWEQDGLNYLPDLDIYENRGPISGILTAIQSLQKPVLVVACDMPFVDEQTIENLISKRNQSEIATAYHNEEGLPEPLLAIWEVKSLDFILKALQNNKTCARKILIQNNAHLLQVMDQLIISNINTPEEQELIRNKISYL